MTSELVQEASIALEALVRTIDPESKDELLPAIESEVVARVLEVTSVLFARARGLLPSEDPKKLRGWSDLDRALLPLKRRGAAPFRSAQTGPLFDQLATRAVRASDEVVTQIAEGIQRAISLDVEVEAIGSVYEELIRLRIVRDGTGLVLGESDARRKAGAHFTQRLVTGPMVVRTLEPLIGRDPLEVRVCDPAMGSGAFLLEACRYLAGRLRERSPKTSETDSLKRVAEKCIFGVDRDPRAVDLARLSLWLLVGSPSIAPGFVDSALVRGDALIGRASTRPKATSTEAETRMLTTEHPDLARAAFDGSLKPLHWNVAFGPVLARGGFDAMVGNPPWVSYAGRAAQPLDAAIRGYYGLTYTAFHGYRNLQALFVERALHLVRAGGRIGFVVPTSMSDLAGYEPSRRAHDVLAETDQELVDLEDGGFAGVFQPCMALLSTRRHEPRTIEKTGVWPLARHDLDGPSRELLDELGARPTLPPHLFGERGFQSTQEDVRRFTTASIPPSTTALRVGGDVAAFSRKLPSLFCDPTTLGSRFRSTEAWRDVAIFIRQTARYPMATRSDGLPFRNSILAGFADDRFDAASVVAYLNSSPVRWYHYMKHRDARQGMPQLKIAHLRAIPALPENSALRADLRSFGERLDTRNTGMTDEEQAELDGLVLELWALGSSARTIVEAWRKGGLQKRATV